MSHNAKVHYLSRTTFDPNDSTVQAQAIVDAEMNKRMDLVHQLAVRLSALEATIAAVNAARHAAIAAGWTEEQLLDLGQVVREAGGRSNRLEGGAQRAVAVCSATIEPPKRRKLVPSKPASSIRPTSSSAPGKRRTLAGR